MALEMSDNYVVTIISESTASCQKSFDILFSQKSFCIFYNLQRYLFVKITLILRHLYIKRKSTSLHFCRIINIIFNFTICSH